MIRVDASEFGNCVRRLYGLTTRLGGIEFALCRGNIFSRAYVMFKTGPRTDHHRDRRVIAKVIEW